jgi:outer membrane assembly lipoprotein YfiO
MRPDRLFLAVVFLVIATGCSRTLILLSPEDLYFMGNHYMQQDKYRSATDQFQRIIDDYPASEYAAMSQFKLAESLYFRKNYTKASLEFELFLEFNPGHKLAPQAHYYLAMSKFNTIINPERDTSAARDTRKNLELFLQRYKDHQDYKKVEHYLEEVHNHLQVHEIEVAKSYIRMRYYQSAINRLEPVLESKASENVKQQALYHLGRAHRHAGNTDEAENYLNEAVSIPVSGKYQRRARNLLRRL